MPINLFIISVNFYKKLKNAEAEKMEMESVWNVKQSLYLTNISPSTKYLQSSVSFYYLMTLTKMMREVYTTHLVWNYICSTDTVNFLFMMRGKHISTAVTTVL